MTPIVQHGSGGASPDGDALARGSGWSLHEIVEATGGTLLGAAPSACRGDIRIDSRQLSSGAIFVAIVGTRFDGHHFLEEAAQRGAIACIVSVPPPPTLRLASLPMVLVPDTTLALGHLARFHRRRMQRPVIAVTGSCGKTTTKELIAHLLADDDSVLKTLGTQNNHIGLPLTLLRLQPRHQWAVVELGSNHPGEIVRLAAIAEPTTAVITNVGPAHLEFFESMAGVLQEKLSLLDAVPPHGTAVLPGDQLEVCLEAHRHLHPEVRVVTFGLSDRCDVQALDVQRTAHGMVMRVRDHLEQWNVPLIGAHNVENALAAVACAWASGVPLSAALPRLRSCVPLPLRSEVIRGSTLTVLNDCYNANPLACARALEALQALGCDRRVAILGDMLELGDHAPSAHQAIGRLAARLGIDVVIAVGQYAAQLVDGARASGHTDVVSYGSVEELLARLPTLVHPGDGVLVKGSRRLRLEQVTEWLLSPAMGTDGDSPSPIGNGAPRAEPVVPLTTPVGRNPEQAHGRPVPSHVEGRPWCESKDRTPTIRAVE